MYSLVTPLKLAREAQNEQTGDPAVVWADGTVAGSRVAPSNS